MHSHIIRRSGRALFGALCLTLWALTTACPGKIGGVVYFDENRDGVKEETEPGAPHVKVVFTRDGKKWVEGYTRSDGTFEIRSKRGYICFQVDPKQIEREVVTSVYGGGAVSIGKGKAASHALATTYESSSRVVDTADQPAYETEDEEQPAYEDKEDGDEGRDVDGGRRKRGGATQGPAGWTSSTTYCEELKWGGFDVELALNLDFEGVLEELPERLTRELEADEIFTLTIPFPAKCALRPIYLPEYFALTQEEQPDIVYDPDTNMVAFGEPDIRQVEEGKLKGAGALSVPHAGIDKVEMKLRVVGDALAPGTTEVTIKPVADCMGKRVTLQKIPFLLVRDLKAAVSLDMSGIPQVGGDDVSLTISVENKGRRTIGEGTIVVTVEPQVAKFILSGGRCTGGGSLVRCVILGLDPGETARRTMEIRMPEEIESDVDVQVSADFEVEGFPQDESLSAATQFSLSVP